VKSIAKWINGITVIALITLIGSPPALAGTFVYVSNAEDGDIGVYSVQTDGSLKPGERAKAANLVYPMAVSPDRRFLYAAARSKPYSVFVYAIDPNTGTLKTLSVSALAESFPYISLDKTGRYLFGASYGSHLISVNAVGEDGRVALEPVQVIPVGRNAHSIRTDESNRFVFVPHARQRRDIPVHVRPEDRASCFEHASGLPDETRARPAPLHYLERQQIHVRAERTDRHSHDAFAE
jgi:6-phosphogluconolactonase